jgi:hypothetical protein
MSFKVAGFILVGMVIIKLRPIVLGVRQANGKVRNGPQVDLARAKNVKECNDEPFKLNYTHYYCTNMFRNLFTVEKE